MIWLAVKYFLFILLAYLLFRLIQINIAVQKLKNQGVYFVSTFPILTDSFKMILYAAKNPNENHIKPWFRAAFADKKIPPIVGMVIFGLPILCVNDPALL
jgi:hypothetical protein